MSFFREFLGLGTPAAAEMPNNYSSGSADPAKWLIDLLGGTVTASGIRINAQVALSVPGINACINVLAEDLAKVPCMLYRRSKDRKRKELATDHPLFPLLSSHPAPWLNTFTWRRAKIAAALTRGNAYSRVIRDPAGRVIRITLLKPGRTTPKWTEEGEPFYDVMESTTKTTYSWQDILHMPYQADAEPSARYAGVIGVSPIARHSEAIALAVAAERFAAAFFRNGAKPSFVVEMDGKLPKDEVANRIRASLERAYSGLDNAFRVAVLELGMKLREVGTNNNDSQLVEVRKEAAVTMCQMFRVPPHKVGILDKATFSNIEHQSIEYVTGPLSALAQALESAIETSCLSEAEREEYFVKLHLDSLMRGDVQSRYRAYAIGRQWGWLNADQVREWEDLDPLPNGKGQEYLVPMNMSNGEDPQNDPQSNPAQDNPMVPRPAQPPQRNNRQRSSLVGLIGETLYLDAAE